MNGAYQITLQLAYCAAPQRAASAWLIPGSCAADWLSELEQWQIELGKVQLLIVARADSAEVVGALALVPDKAQPQVTPRAQPYGRIGQRLYLPIAARVEPAATDQELLELLTSPSAINIWHPALGLLHFEAQDAFGIEQLLARPTQRAVSWDLAQPGSALSRRLVSIELAEPPNIEAFLRAGGDGIGDSGEQLNELPPHPDERSPLGQLGGAVLGGIAGGLSGAAGMASKLMGGGAPGGWLSKLQDWAQRQQTQISQSLEVERNRQLARLLEMLQRNPDEGLRYALPLANNAAPRGVAPPGSKLSQRTVDFSLGGLGGGQAVDGWDTGNYHQKLLESYRALANRELGLGRYRRAAYIFGELLGDLRAAASALESGGHYREAAALYQHKLGAPQEAARCLLTGQLWSEAIALYETLQAYETIGDLYLKLDDRDLASAAFRRAVDQCLQQRDQLGAARLLEYKLDDVDAAYHCLQAGWPISTQAPRCLTESFHLLARHLRHEEALRRVRQLSAGHMTADASSAFLACTTALAIDYPDREVRIVAADRTRAIVSQRLDDATPSEASTLLGYVSRLAPHDKVLARDGQRYVQQRQVLAPRQKVTRRAGEIKLIREFSLPLDVTWNSALYYGEVLFAAGWRDNYLEVVRVSRYDDAIQRFPKPWFCASKGEGILLAAGHDLLVHPLGLPLEEDRSFPDHASFAIRGPLRCGGHASVSKDTVGLHYTSVGGLVSVDLQMDVTLNLLIEYFANRGAQFTGTKTVQFSGEWEVQPTQPACTITRDSSVIIGWGNKLAIVEPANVTYENLPHEVTSLACSTERQARAAVSMTNGALLLENTLSERSYFAHDLHAPRVAFIESRRIVAAAAQGIEVYSTVDHQLTLLSRGGPLHYIPLAVFPQVTSRTFGVLFTNGTVRIYGY